MSMFCPQCKGLLKVRRKGSGNEKYCPKCSGIEDLQADIRAPATPIGELKGHPTIPFFPFPVVRKGQDKFIRDVAKSISTGKHLLAYAPTGIGKTVAALVPAVEASLAIGKTVCFLTSKQSQHHIAIETLKQMKAVSGRYIRVLDIISKQAMCPHEISNEFPAAFRLLCHASQKSGTCRYYTRADDGIVKFIHANIMHVEELKNLATKRGVCPHKVAFQAAAEADIIVCDYNHVFDPEIRPQTLESFGKSLEDLIVIVDEAHNLPDRIRGYYSRALTTHTLDEATSEVRKSQHATILRGLRKDLMALFDSVDPGKEVLTSPEALMAPLEKRMSRGIVEQMDLESLIDDLRKVGEKRLKDGRNSSALDVAEFLDGYRKEMKGLIRIISHKDGQVLYYRLLDPSVVAAPVFAEFHSSVLMSGTLHPTQVYADILGIPENSRMLGSYLSPFPDENRPVYVAEDVTTLYGQRGEAMYRRIAGRINDACAQIPGNVAVFFQSYGMLRNIEPHLNIPKDPITETRESSKAEKREMINNLGNMKNGRGGLLLAVMGGSLSEGIDYKDNLLDSVMVVGLPFAPPSLEQDMLIRYYDEKFGRDKGRDYGYTYPAMSRVLQAMGRCIRSETDRAAVILLDKRFMYPMYRRCLPNDINPRPAGDLKAELKKFYA